MPFHDLNVCQSSPALLSQTLAFLSELEYSVIAISVSITGKIPATPEPVGLAGVTVPRNCILLSRLTLTISDTSHNHRLASLQPAYDLIALRPTTEQAFSLCCGSLDCEIISLDLSQRLPFILKFKTVASALQRGIRFEICYSPGIISGNDARRNLISGATSLIRATRGRGIIISSEARSALSARGPWDVINLGQVWGLNQEKGKEAICEEARKVVQLAKLKRESFRGVVHVIHNGQSASKPSEDLHNQNAAASNRTLSSNPVKRKASAASMNTAPTHQDEEKPVSKREMKRRAKMAKIGGKEPVIARTSQATPDGFPIRHETIVEKPQEKL